MSIQAVNPRSETKTIILRFADYFAFLIDVCILYFLTTKTEPEPRKKTATGKAICKVESLNKSIPIMIESAVTKLIYKIEGIKLNEAGPLVFCFEDF